MHNIADELEALRAATRRLSERLEHLESRDAIATVIRNVARALDRLDRGLLLEQFHADAQIDYGAIFRGPITGFVEVALQFQGAMRDTQHLVGNIQIDLIDESIASAESYVYAHHTVWTEEGLVELVVGGRYLDRLSRRDGTWRIAARTEVLDWGRRLPITEEWFDQNHELPKGLRNSSDLSYQFMLSGKRSL